MSTQSKTHNNHHVNRATAPTNGGARNSHSVQARAPAPKSGSPSGGASKQAVQPAHKNNIRPAGNPPTRHPQGQATHKVTPLTQADLSRMTSAVSRQHGGALPKDSYVSEMQSRLDKREAASSAKSPAPAPAPRPRVALKEQLQRNGQGKR